MATMKIRSLAPWLLPALAVGVLACSSSPDEPSSTSAGGASSSSASSTNSSAASASGGSTSGGGGGLPQAKHVAYLNFSGAVWSSGEDDATKRTSLLVQVPGGGGKVAIAGFAAAIGPHPDGAQRDAIITKATALVTAALAPFDVSVTTRRPTVPFTEVVIGGAPEDIGMAPGPAGVAALDCDETNPTNTAFVFADSGALLIPVEADGAATTIASTALHELGHTWGLVHTNDQADIMNPNNSSSLKWGSGAVIAGGNDAPDSCGRSTQDSAALLMMHLGSHVERAEVPVVAAGKGPVVVASTPVSAPEPGLATGTKLAPCLKLSSSSNVVGAFAETWVQSTRWVRLSRGAQLGTSTPLFQFDPVDTPPGLPMFERESAVDASDDVTEVRAWLLPSAGGPVLPPCN
jgi:matrixin